MKHAVTRQAAQGDVLFRKVDKLPSDAKLVERKGDLVVAHSETGHHHVVRELGVQHFDIGDPMICYLVSDGVPGFDVVHNRSFDTHGTLRLEGGVGSVWEVRRQREHTPEGWRRVED